MTTTNFLVSIVLPFPVCYIVGVIQYVASVNLLTPVIFFKKEQNYFTSLVRSNVLLFFFFSAFTLDSTYIILSFSSQLRCHFLRKAVLKFPRIGYLSCTYFHCMLYIYVSRISKVRLFLVICIKYFCPTYFKLCLDKYYICDLHCSISSN